MNSQLATALAAISAQLDNLIQITESSNQTLDRIITKVEKKPENPTLLVATPVIKESSDRDYSKLSPTIKCYKCQGYGHVAANCPTPVKVHQVREPPVTNSELLPPLLSTPPSPLPLLSTPTVIVCFDRRPLPLLLPTPSPVITEIVDVLSEEPICQVEESEDSDLDEKIMGVNLGESSTPSPLEVVPDITDFRDAVMREPHNLQSINFFSLTAKPKGTFTQILPVKISLVIINKVIGKLSHTFMLVRLIIPFDRGREYC